MSPKNSSHALQRALFKLLTPLARVLLRNGISFSEFAEIAKRAYVDVATKEFGIPGRSQTTSRIATLTGLTRKDVQRIKNSPQDDEKGLDTSKYNRAARVISAWISNEEFLDDAGQPTSLPLEGSPKSFSALVKEASGDITVRTILDELQHVGAITTLEDGRIKLLTRAYIPKGDDAEKISILGADVADLISSIDHNLTNDTEVAFFQRKVCYDNLPLEVIEELRQKIAAKGQAALESMNEDMSAADRDRNPHIKGHGRVRAGLGIYYFERTLEPDDKSDGNKDES